MLTSAQIYMIWNHIEVAQKINEAVNEVVKERKSVGQWDCGPGERRFGDYRYTLKTAEEIETERKAISPCTHPEVVECENCNPKIDPYKEQWDDNVITGVYYASDSDAWEITETEDEIRGYTTMNNFDMKVYLKEIGIPDKAMKVHNED